MKGTEWCRGMNKILTIVVPTYNAEKYLRRNLDSFCMSTILKDIEVLVVNDGSTDNSLTIAEEYAARFPDSYRVITKENRGHGSGINCGIQNASGFYFKVVDADDWVDQKSFCHLVEMLKKKKADVVYSGFLWVYDHGDEAASRYRRKAEIKKPFKNVVFEKKYRFDAVAKDLYIKMHHMTIRTDILRKHQIKIDENCFYVDMEYVTFPIPYVQSICFMKEYVYMYRIGSQSQSVGIEKMQQNECDYTRVFHSLLNFYNGLGKTIPCTAAKKQYIAKIIARMVAGKIKIMLSFPGNRKKKRELEVFDKKIKSIYPEIYYGNVNKGVSILRSSRYLMYYPASILVRKRN